MDHNIFSKLKFRSSKGRPLMTRFFERHKISIPESKLVDFNSTPFKAANSHDNYQTTLTESTKIQKVDKGNQTIFDENLNIVTKGSQRSRKSTSGNAHDELNSSRKRKHVDATTTTDDIQQNQTDKEKIAQKSSVVTSHKRACVLDVSTSSGVGDSESTTQAKLIGSSFHRTVNTATSVDASNFLAPAELGEQSFNGGAGNANNTKLGVDASWSASSTVGIFKTQTNLQEARPDVTAQDGLINEKTTDNSSHVENRHQGLSLSTSRRSEERLHASPRQHQSRQLLLGTDSGISTTSTPLPSPGNYFLNPPEMNAPVTGTRIVDDTATDSSLRHSHSSGSFTSARANYILDKFFPLDSKNLPGIKHWKSILSETPRSVDTSHKYLKPPVFTSNGVKRFFEICDYVKSWSEYEKKHATNMKGK